MRAVQRVITLLVAGELAFPRIAFKRNEHYRRSGVCARVLFYGNDIHRQQITSRPFSPVAIPAIVSIHYAAIAEHFARSLTIREIVLNDSSHNWLHRRRQRRLGIFSNG